MKSSTKNKLPLETVAGLLSANGLDPNGLKELKGGMFNAAYMAGSSVVKIGPPPGERVLTYEKDIMRAEVEVYRLLADKPIPTPKIIAHDTSRALIDSEFFIMERVDGVLWKDAKISKNAKGGLMRELGRCNAAVHSVEGGWFGYIKGDARYRFDSLRAAFTSMVGDILSEGKALGHKLPYGAIEAVVKANHALLDKVKRPTLVDFDMWAGNVFVKDGHISGVVDFERSFYGDPYADFTSAVMIFTDVENEPEFRGGYEEASGKQLTVNADDRRRMDLYRLYLAVIMYVETYRFNKIYAAMVQRYCAANIGKLLKRLQ